MCPGRPRTHAVYYRSRRGLEPVGRFIESLAAKPAAKIVDYIEQHLNGKQADEPPPPFPITSQIDGELRELRVRFARTRYRILYRRSGNLVVLLHAFEKNTEMVPSVERNLAKQRWADFKCRMEAQPREPPRAAGRDAPSVRR